MNKPKAFFVVSEWNNDVSWIKEYTDDYLIYDKSNTLLPDEHILKVPNVGYNIHDILDFITRNYDNLPELTAFLEGNPFDHCKKEVFDKLIYNEEFTPIEYYGNIPANGWEQRDENGGFMEINNSWYVPAHIIEHGKEVHKFFSSHNSYNDFLGSVFDKPDFPDWIRFAPGGQYIVPKENILFYSKKFYENLKGYVNYHRIPCEGFILERALYYIFTNKFKEREVYDNL